MRRERLWRWGLLACGLGALVILCQLALIGVVRAGRAPWLADELELSIHAMDLRAESAEEITIRTVTWVSRRLSDGAGYDAASTPNRSDWLRDGLASRDQQVSLTQQLLYRNGVTSRSLALYGEWEESHHTVLGVESAEGEVIVDPYFGWVLRRPTGALAGFDDVGSGRFEVENVDPEDELGQYPRVEYQRLFKEIHPPEVLGPPLGGVYNAKYKALIWWSTWTARLLRLLPGQPHQLS